MIRYRCDGCSQDLAPDGSNHYIVKIEAFAAAGRLEFTREDLEKDHEAEMRKLLAQAERRSPDELEDQVYRSFRYDLCPACHHRFLKNPMGFGHNSA
ncbi:MAG TPA: hypothetical protein VJZ71_08055 [Phycisphaerae bacterium]|nr:hypothetical protein [Phycisphaerae bacterium]